MNDRGSRVGHRTQVSLTPVAQDRRARLVLGVLPRERRERRVRRLRSRAATWALASFGFAMLAVAITAIDDILMPSFSSGAPPSLWVPPVEAETTMPARSAEQHAAREGSGLRAHDDSQTSLTSASFDADRAGGGRMGSRSGDDAKAPSGRDRSGSSGRDDSPEANGTDTRGSGGGDDPPTGDDHGSRGSPASDASASGSDDDSGGTRASESDPSEQEPGDDSSSSSSGSGSSGSDNDSGSSGPSGSSGSGDDSGSSGSSGSGSDDDSGGGRDGSP